MVRLVGGEELLWLAIGVSKASQPRRLQEDEMSELLPCPFCGSAAMIMTHPLTGDKYFAAACTNTDEGCWASEVPDTAICNTKEKAAEIWNTRATDNTADQIAELESKLADMKRYLACRYSHVGSTGDFLCTKCGYYPGIEDE